MTRIINIFFVTLLLALLTGSCSRSDNRNSAPVCEITAGMDSIFTPVFPENAPGAIVVVMKGDSIMYSRSFGMANYQSETRVTDSTMFNICSITKQFSAAALLKLQEQGLLSLEDSLAKFFPEFPSDIYKRVKLKHLLNHTSGLPDIRPRTPEEWTAFRAKADSCIFGRLEDYKLYSRADESKRTFHYIDSLKFEPGTRFDYQNPTYQLIYYIIQRVTGMDFETWMSRNIFEPAGMRNFWYYHQNYRYPNLSHGYATPLEAASDGMTIGDLTPDGKYGEYDYGEARFFPTWADGGLYTTGADFMAWQSALMHDRVISAASRALMTVPYIDSDWDDSQYGYGLYIQTLPGMPRKFFHHGDNGGYYAYQAIFPDNDVAYLIFSTRHGWDRQQLAAQVDQILRQHRWI